MVEGDVEGDKIRTVFQTASLNSLVDCEVNLLGITLPSNNNKYSNRKSIRVQDLKSHCIRIC